MFDTTCPLRVQRKRYPCCVFTAGAVVLQVPLATPAHRVSYLSVRWSFPASRLSLQ